MPMYCSMMRAMPGAFSRTEFSSSPRRTPMPMACLSWSMAAAWPCASAPPMTNCLLTCSMKEMSSSLLLNAALALAPILATAEAVSK